MQIFSLLRTLSCVRMHGREPYHDISFSCLGPVELTYFLFTVLLWNIRNLKSVKKKTKHIFQKNPKLQFNKETALIRPILGDKINFAVSI